MDGVRSGTVPAGSVAVLINRAHTFSDLVCTVDAFEAPLLGGIDGRRTLAQICAHVAGDGSKQRRAVASFERLWHYDQMCFDASR